MQKRSVTRTILIALLTLGTPAAYLLWALQQQTFAAIDAERRVDSQVADVARTLSAIATVQQGYVAPGQLDEPLFEEAALLLARLSAQAQALGPMLRSAQAATHAGALRQAVEDLHAADARTRENLTRGQELMAADVIYSDGRNLVDGITARLRDAQAAERQATSASLARTSRWMWLLFGVVALAPAAGLAAFLRSIRRATGAVIPAPAAPAADATPTLSPTVDMAATAALCTEISRVADTQRLATLLGRAAGLVNASGAMLWMGAGDRLFAALAYGYPPDIVSRLPPLARDADNAAARAWRSAQRIRIPRSADGSAAVVAPLFNADACVGVLAVEMTPGREADDEVEIAVALVAAQLATVVSAWPVASLPERASRAAEARTA